MFSLQLARQNTPIILHGTPLTSWKSVANWTITSLASRTNKIGHILSKKGRSNIFKYYAVNQPLSTIDSMNEEKDYNEIIYSARTFFQILRNQFDGFYYYASGGIQLLNLGEMIMKDHLRVMTFPSHTKYSEIGEVNFWLGKTNVTAFTHYDTSYNLHFVANGRKKFILIPPDSYSKLRLYPCLHQLYRQVSTDILSENDNLQEFLRSVNGQEAELIDGDVLYLPPYWFHCVITMDTTLSFNIWSQSESFTKMEVIYNSAIPFEPEWGEIKLMRSLNYFVKLLANEVLSYSNEKLDVSEFMIDRVYGRYNVIFRKKRNVSILEESKRAVYEYCLRTSITEVLGKHAVEHIENKAMKIAELFLGIHPAAVREINLGNYIEHLVFRMLKTEDLLHLPAYIHECFT